MKIRSGFVSNSSSSSFIVLATAKAHASAMKQLNGDERQCVNTVLQSVEAFGQNLVCIEAISSDDYSTLDPEELNIPEELEEKFNDALYKWKKLVTKDPKDGIERRIDL